jgi:hypothetical protein
MIRAQWRSDDPLIRHVALENPEIAPNAVHARHESFGDRGVVIGQVATDERGDQLRLRGREQFAADRGGECGIGLQGRMGAGDGADRGGREG